LIDSEAAIEKGFSAKLGAIKLYHSFQKSKNSFCFGQSKFRDRISLKIAREANLTLAEKRITISNSKNPERKPQTHWAAINAAYEKIAENGKSWNPEHIYDCARTFFQNSV
jgi:hypothetical protein